MKGTLKLMLFNTSYEIGGPYWSHCRGSGAVDADVVSISSVHGASPVTSKIILSNETLMPQANSDLHPEIRSSSPVDISNTKAF